MEHRLAQLEEARLENLRLHKLLNFKKQHDTLAQGIAAHVIGRQTDSLSHILIVDCGSNHNLKVNNPVFTPGGVVGRIIACGPQSAKVLLLVDQNSACDVLIQRNRIRGTLQGTGGDLCRLAYLQRTADVKVGDQLITSGLDNIFPKGITVGTVVTTARNHNGLSQQIKVKPEFDFNTIEEVFRRGYLVLNPIFSGITLIPIKTNTLCKYIFFMVHTRKYTWEMHISQEVNSIQPDISALEYC